MITSLILGGSIFILLLVIALYVVYVIGLWKLFKKAGKQGWEAIIPFYNTYVLVEISGLNWWYFLIAISGTILGMLKINGLDYVANIATLVTRFFIFWNIGKKMNQNHVPIAILCSLPSANLPSARRSMLCARRMVSILFSNLFFSLSAATCPRVPNIPELGS